MLSATCMVYTASPCIARFRFLYQAANMESWRGLSFGLPGPRSFAMPSGVFRPYAGVSTAILFFTRGARTDRIWFYDMEHDGFSLDDKRQLVLENDVPDVLACWKNRKDSDFISKRSARLDELKKKIAPLKADRLKHHEIIHRLKFEEVVAVDPEKAKTTREKAEAELAELQASIAPLQAEINQLGRQFWVEKKQVVANKYDLSASLYREVDQEHEFFEKPAVTLERLTVLDNRARRIVAELVEFSTSS